MILFKRDDLSFESKRVIMSSGLYFCRARRGKLAASPSRTTFNRDTAQPKYDRSIDSGCGRFKTVRPWLKMIFFSAHSKGHGGRFRVDEGWDDRGPEVNKGHVIYRSKRKTITIFLNLEFINYQS